MRTKNPEQRKIDIRWSTRRWVPRIVVMPANGRCTSLEPMSDPYGLFGKKPLKRRQTTLLWSRDESRPTWR